MADEMHWLLCSEKLETSLYKEEATSLNNVVDKKYIIKPEWKRNYDVFS